jgi:hypothetical protein
MTRKEHSLSGILIIVNLPSSLLSPPEIVQLINLSASLLTCRINLRPNDSYQFTARLYRIFIIARRRFCRLGQFQSRACSDVERRDETICSRGQSETFRYILVPHIVESDLAGMRWYRFLRRLNLSLSYPVGIPLMLHHLFGFVGHARPRISWNFISVYTR